MQTTTTTLYY